MKYIIPKKIYLFKNPISEEVDDRWLSVKSHNDDIEYVRKDVFIEKICEWLKKNKNHPFIGCEDCCLSGILTDDFIEEFRKAIKEE